MKRKVTSVVTIKWVLQIRLILPGPMTHTINTMDLTLKYMLDSMFAQLLSGIDQTTQENRLTGDIS